MRGAQVDALDSWNLNEQAAVARAFLDTSLTVLPGDVNQDGARSTADVWAFVGGWLSDTSALTDLDKMKAGDLDLSGKTDADDFVLLREALNGAGGRFQSPCPAGDAGGGTGAVGLVAELRWGRGGRGIGSAPIAFG